MPVISRVSIDESILTDIADSIRTKNGESDLYAPQEMSDKIDEILVPSGSVELTTNGTYDITEYASVVVNTAGITPTGTKTITTNGTHDVTSYASAEVDVPADLTPYFYTTISAGSNSSNSGYKNVVKKLPDNLTVSGTSLDFAFTNSQLTSLPTLNTSSVTSMQMFAQGCSQITSFPQYNTTNVTAFSHLCWGCSSLTDVPVLDLSSAVYLDQMFKDCYSLSNASLNNILASLLTATNYNDTKTLAQIGLTSTQATTCTGLSNWAALSSSGWSTGY